MKTTPRLLCKQGVARQLQGTGFGPDADGWITSYAADIGVGASTVRPDVLPITAG